MEILFTVVVIIIVVYALLKDTIIYIVQCYKYKYLAAGVFFQASSKQKEFHQDISKVILYAIKKNIFDENAIAIFNSYHTMLGYVAAKETYLFLPLFEYENRIFIKGVIYPKKI